MDGRHIRYVDGDTRCGSGITMLSLGGGGRGYQAE
ncbi:hypothetical protein E2C01_088919 [Portunus trituberculatus]|uniref:Uncharacterized protein n=1 Tax=Portunus trituberculatus TaxID=210409 RepID=A0A5B7JL48_PORTR|nr:hypothetical protein [Portunus trituberculatus]